MTSKSVYFYFDFGSPAAYLAYTQLPKLVADTGATLAMQPMLLGGVFQLTGNRPPISVPQKGAYVFRDLNRFAKRYGVRLNMNPHFPINTVTLMRIDVGLGMRDDSRLTDYRDAVFRAIWVDEKNMNDAAVVASVLAAASLNPEELAALAAEQEVKDRLKELTQSAVDRGVFGAPTFFVDEQMFWGQDRLDFVVEALS